MNKLWGGRFATEPNAQMRALNDSIGFDLHLYVEDIHGSRAYAEALTQIGLLSAEENQQIQAGLNTIEQEMANGHFTPHSGDEDIHTAVERRLGELIGVAAGKLHTGRSRNDQVAADLRLWLKKACHRAQSLIRDLQKALIAAAEPQLHTIMPGYTHFQPAQPITVAHWLMSFFWMIQRDLERFAACQTRIDLSPLGSGALAGTPYPIDREALAQQLGFAGVTPNSLDAVSDRDGVAEYLFAAALLLTHLSRLAEDIILYANPALGFIKLPDAYSTGSSLMPQKRNPDPLELTRGKTGRIIGHLGGFLATLKGLPSTYNKDLQEDKEPAFDAAHTLELVLPVLAGLIPQLEWVPAKLQAALDENLLATELADYLVQKGLPFREAHHLVGQVVRAAEAQNYPLSQLPLAVYQNISPLFAEDVYPWLTFEGAVQRRQSSGGTAPSAVQAQIAAAKEKIKPWDSV
jgi:argininosuccinate lyase